MRLFLMPCLLLFVLLGNSLAAEQTSVGHYPETTIKGYYLVDTEYLPQIKEKVSTLIEQGTEFKVLWLNSPGLSLQIGGGYGLLRQKNELFDDDDYALTQKSIFVGFSLARNKNFSMRGKISLERYANDGQDGYYRLEDDEDLFTGSINCTWQSQPWRITGKYYRSRETDPVYNVADERAQLKLGTQGLAGLEVGYRFAPNWETAVSLYHENYGTDQKDQYNINGQVAYRTKVAILSRVAAGAGYYLEEKETIVNLSMDGGHKVNSELFIGWNSEVEWSDVEESILIGGSLWCRLGLSKSTALQLQLQGEQETGDDKDALAMANLSFNLKF